MQSALLQYQQPFTWAASALCSSFLLGVLWDAEDKIVLGYIHRPFGLSLYVLGNASPWLRALGLNIKWAGVINSLTPQ